MTVMDDRARVTGEAFARHLGERGDAAALDFARVLADGGDGRRSEFLTAFVKGGEQTRPAPWWAPGAVCHVSIAPPTELAAGDLWFDPLEVSWSLVVPWIRDPLAPVGHYDDLPEFCDWIPLEPVSDWQLWGAHQLAPGVAASRAKVTGLNASRYSQLFGKYLTSWTTWAMAGLAYDLDLVMRLWGQSVAEVGLGGSHDEAAHVVTRADILRVTDPDAPFPEQRLDRDEVGLDFRASVDLQYGLASGDNTLERAWHR